LALAGAAFFFRDVPEMARAAALRALLTPAVTFLRPVRAAFAAAFVALPAARLTFLPRLANWNER
jgi:hypothetical protein